MKIPIKITTIFFSISLALASCSTPTMVSSSWHKPGATANNYRNIFIVAISKDVTTKQSLENGLQAILQQRGITVEKSLDVFPPTFSNQNGLQHQLVLNTIQGTNADGILTVNIVRKENETHYDGPVGFWNPGIRYGYYNNFWGYYNNWYPQAYAEGYYDTTKIYYIETNLYNAKTEQLIWAAQSKTYDPANIQSFLKGYVDAITKQMAKDGLINPGAAI